MFVRLNLKKSLIAGLVLSGSVAVSVTAAALTKSGVEYPVFPSLPLDQALPHLSLGPTGGYIVAQDTIIDGNGLGLRARRLNADLSMGATPFSVNSITAGDQQRGKVAVLPNGGAVFVWQSSTARGNKIYARFMGPDQSFLGEEVGAADRTFGHQSDAAVAALNDGTVVVVWSEEEREPAPDNRMAGIFAQRFTSEGQRLGATFRVNTVTYLNQRTPAIAALANGGFVVAWVSDEFRVRNSDYIDIAARVFDAQGNPLGEDFALNSGNEICANPSIVATADGFRAAWSGRTLPVRQVVSAEPPVSSGIISTQVVSEVQGLSTNRWDVWSRTFSSAGAPAGPEVIVNSTKAGDQYSPRLLRLQTSELVLWTSFWQDGSFEGIYGRVVRGGDFESEEFIVNTHRAFGQMFPTAGAVGDRVLVAWSSFLSASKGFDLVAQQFTVSADPTLPTPATPFAFALSQNEIGVTWAEIGGQGVAAYRVHVDNESTPIETTDGMLRVVRSEWAPGSTHNVRLSYRLADGRVSPLSDPVAVTTWGADTNGDSLPDDWQRENWGKQWPLASADSDGDGASNLSEFLAGTDPTDPASVLKVVISPRAVGLYLQWPTQPGSYYQLQTSSDLRNWTDSGGPRFAPATSDSEPMNPAGQVQYYRVIRMR